LKGEKKGDYSHAAPFKMYCVGFHAFQPSPPIETAFGWFPCVQIYLVILTSVRVNRAAPPPKKKWQRKGASRTKCLNDKEHKREENKDH